MGETTVPANPTVCCLCLRPEQAKPSLHETGTVTEGQNSSAQILPGNMRNIYNRCAP